jgi:hypothetical protein
MPKFFFHLHTENGIDRDSVGVDFPSLEAAVNDAQRARFEYLRDEGINDPREERRCRFEITDQDGRIITMVPRANL